jgi:uncharacterized RDD family membrane protein YckC
MAYSADLGILYFIFLLIQGGLLRAQSEWDPTWRTNGWLLELYTLATVSVPAWSYFILMESSTSGATLGKLLMRLRVRCLDGEHPTTKVILKRTAIKLLPLEIAQFSVNIPQNPMVDPETGEYLGLVETHFSWGLALAYAILIGSMLSVSRHPLHRAFHDLVAGTLVVLRPRPGK